MLNKYIVLTMWIDIMQNKLHITIHCCSINVKNNANAVKVEKWIQYTHKLPKNNAQIDKIYSDRLFLLNWRKKEWKKKWENVKSTATQKIHVLHNLKAIKYNKLTYLFKSKFFPSDMAIILNTLCRLSTIFEIVCDNIQWTNYLDFIFNFLCVTVILRKIVQFQLKWYFMLEINAVNLNPII